MGFARTATTLYNYDQDRDAFPGRLIQKGASGASETDLVKYQNWRMAAPAEGLTLSGNATLTLWSAMKDFHTNSGQRTKRGYVVAYLRDVPASGAATPIGTTSVSRASWHGGLNQWMQDTITFPEVNYTVASGRFLELKIVVHSNSDDDMWFAYDTKDHPARLILPQ